MIKSVKIHLNDNVAVLAEAAKAGEWISASGQEICLRQDVPAGHKVALCEIQAGEKIVKYGSSIGCASQPISTGEWVHSHNLKTNLQAESAYVYSPKLHELPQIDGGCFQGFLRPDGRAATRNEIWILPTVGCINSVAARLAREAQRFVGGSLDGVYAFGHPYGCSQLGDDLLQTRRMLVALANHPNAVGVLIVGLGCENNRMADFQVELGAYDPQRIRFMLCQDCEDEIESGLALLEELADYARGFQRQPVPVSKLLIGLKCGGSDGFSGITANPVVGRLTDMVCQRGAAAVLTETPEMFGAEHILFDRCINQAVFQRAADMISNFKQYFVAHGQPVYENPSPGNKDGGITTLEEKSLGCVQKGGEAPICDVLDYGCQVQKRGLSLLYGPGNDMVSCTAMVAAGAHMILFTSGRGTPFGTPAPTIKISSNTTLWAKKRNWIDFNAGSVLEGESIAEAAERLYQLVIQVAEGRRTCAEQMGLRDIAIFKNGVTL